MSTFVCRVMGILLLVLAFWGFAAGGHVLMFQVSPLQNVLHLATGALALWFGYKCERHAHQLSLLFGIIYGLIALLGLGGIEPVVDRLRLNPADNWLHLLVG